MEDGFIELLAEYSVPAAVIAWYLLFALGSMVMHRRLRSRASRWLLAVALAPPVYYALRFVVMTLATVALGNDARIMTFHQYDSIITLSFCFAWLPLSSALFCLCAKSISPSPPRP
ncbi:hypothetical protein [Lysobacter sp. CA199]|uniref:hypothetical protein n=1 Tax=Lysobacter sp. CA199 TaxID=3455608 RepID=UPI003F8D2F2A